MNQLLLGEDISQHGDTEYGERYADYCTGHGNAQGRKDFFILKYGFIAAQVQLPGPQQKPSPQGISRIVNGKYKNLPEGEKGDDKYKNQKSVNNCLSGYLTWRQMWQPGFFRSLFLHDKELLS